MSDMELLQVQKHQLEQLLQEAGDDPVLAPQLRQRLQATTRDLQAAQLNQDTIQFSAIPRAAIFMRGAAVVGSAGIRPGLAGEALIQYEKMFIEQAIHDERAAARSTGRQRRPRGSPPPELLFTGTPRGSFGLEFVPVTTRETTLDQIHIQSLHHLADALMLAADGDVGEVMKKIPAGVLQPLKQFMKSLAGHDAELRLAFSDGVSRTISSKSIQGAADRLEREVNQETLRTKGVFRGLTFESGHFDLISDELGIVTGTVSEDLSAEDLQRIDSLTDHRCEAFLQKTVVSTITGASAPSYILLEADELTE